MSSQLGHSRDVYTYSILLAVRAVARALNARVEYVKVPRCSDKFSIVADALSQGQVEYAKELLGEYAYGQYSSTLMKWLCDPVPTRVLGQAIVKELSEKYEVIELDTEWEFEVDKLVAHNPV